MSSPETRAVWIVRSRQIATRFRFWLALFGYNPRDHSLSHKIYLLYAAVFYSLWVFAVLSLLAGGAARLLQATGLSGFQSAATSIATLGLICWVLFLAYTASRRSPLDFSEDDAYLICQTPASRRTVAIAWLIGQWPGVSAPIWAIAVTLGFGVIEGISQGNLTGADIPRYILAGFRALSIVIPLQLGLLSLIWALGAYRLQKDDKHPRLFLLPFGIAGLLLYGLLASGSGSFLSRLVPGPQNGSYPTLISRILWPMTFPLETAFGYKGWPYGLLIAFLWMICSLLLLSWVAASLNLSRASQESRGVAERELGLWFGDILRKEALNKQEHLGIGHKASNIPAHTSWGALFWKDQIQTSRLRILPQLFSWLAIFVLGTVTVLFPEWGVRAWALFMWVILVMGQTTRRLQDDLALWMVFRPLPIPAERLILGEIAVSGAIAICLSWVSLAFNLISRFIPLPLFYQMDISAVLSLWLLIPLLVANIALSGSMDVLRQAKNINLIAGQSPQPGPLGLLLGGGSVLLVGALILALRGHAWLPVQFLALILSLAIGLILLRAAAFRLRRIR